MGSQELDELLEEALELEEELEAEEDEPEEAGPAREPTADYSEEAQPEPEAYPDPEAAELAGDAASFPRIASIGGVPLWWERIPPEGPRRFPVAPDFLPVLEQAVRAIQNRTPKSFGKLTRIVTAGMFVAKGGAHEAGHACDWDRLVFENLEIAPIERDHLSPSLATRRRYWAFAAACRSVAAPTLHGEYDEGPHDDHVHLADNLPFGFSRASEASVSLCQAMMNDIFGQTPKLTIDKRYGEKTDAAITAALSRLRLDGTLDDPRVWRRFLRRSARLGFVLSVRQ